VRKLLGQDAVFIFMVPESEMALVKRLVERKTKSFENVVCNCNFVICTVKYTHTCTLGMGFKLVLTKVLLLPLALCPRGLQQWWQALSTNSQPLLA
jgi:hypothetical protein